MGNIKYGDLISLAKAGEYNVIINPANCFHKMGAGFARLVRNEWPEVYEADLKTPCGDKAKLGTIDVVPINNYLSVVNAYTQFNYSWTERVVDYNAVKQCMIAIAKRYPPSISIAYPRIGSGCAGGSWTKSKLIIDDVLRSYNHTLVRLPYPIAEVVSGGQTGADLAGLLAAEELGIPTGGIAPKDYRTESGKQPILKTRFGLTEDDDWRYEPRTKKNIINSDATLIMSPDEKSTGTILTRALAIKYKKPYLIVNPFSDDVIKAVNFLTAHRPNTLNVAGNRESVSPRLTIHGRNWLIKVLEAYK